jgi:hypothetical protein
VKKLPPKICRGSFAAGYAAAFRRMSVELDRLVDGVADEVATLRAEVRSMRSEFARRAAGEMFAAADAAEERRTLH